MPDLNEDLLKIIKDAFSDGFVKITEKWSDSIPVEKQEKFIKSVHKEFKNVLKKILEAGEIWGGINDSR